MRKLWEVMKAFFKVLGALGSVGLVIWLLNYFLVERPKQTIDQQSLAVQQTSVALEQTRQAREAAPKIVNGYIIAKSPDLMAKSDQEQIAHLWGLKVRVVPTKWQRSELSRYVEGSDTWYLFFFMVNLGPGRAEQIDIDVRIRPKGGTDFEPAGDLTDGLADWLRGNSMAQRDAFALLLDSIKAPSRAEADLLVANGFLSRCFWVTGSFCDVSGRCYDLFELDPYIVYTTVPEEGEKGKTIGCREKDLTHYFQRLQ